jgi:hypothetical protein
LGRDKGTYGSFLIQDVKCGSNHREKDDKKRMGYWKLVLKHKGLLRNIFAFVFGLANGDNLSHCRSSQLDHFLGGRVGNFEWIPTTPWLINMLKVGRSPLPWHFWRLVVNLI